MSDGAALVERVQALLDLRRYDDALALLAGQPDAHLLRSRALLGLSRAADALAAADAGVAAEPADPYGHVLRSFALLRLRRAGSAAQAAGEAVRLAPGWAGGWEALAQAQIRGGERAAAQDSVARVLELEPHRAVTHALAGDLAAARSDPATAERAYRTALSLAPGDGHLLIALGRVVQAQGRPVEGEELIAAGLAATPALAGTREEVVRGAWLTGVAGAAVVAQLAGTVLLLVVRGAYAGPTRLGLLAVGVVCVALLGGLTGLRDLLTRSRSARARLVPLRAPRRVWAAAALGGLLLGFTPWTLAGLFGGPDLAWALAVPLAGGALVGLGRLDGFTRRRRGYRSPGPAAAPEVRRVPGDLPVGRYAEVQGVPTVRLRTRRTGGHYLVGAWLVVGLPVLFRLGPLGPLALVLPWVALDAVLLDRLWPALLTRTRVTYLGPDDRRAGLLRLVAHGAARLAVSPYLLVLAVRQRDLAPPLVHDRLTGVRPVVVRPRPEHAWRFTRPD